METLLLAGLPLCKLGLHLLLSGRYGYHVDELYFIACGRHLAFGYVDHPPLVPWVARLSGELFGYSLISLRLFPALAGALALLLTLLIVRQFGGGRFAQSAAGLAMLVAPVYLRSGSLLCLPAFEVFFWTLGAYLLVRLAKTQDARLWLLVGAVAGIGLLNKHTMLVWGLGVGTGLLLPPQRRWLRNPYLWSGTLLALLIFLPNLVWQHQHDWPTLEFIRRIDTSMLAGIPRSLFLLGQVLYLHPLALPVWATGLVFFFTTPGRPYRTLGWVYIAALVVFLVRHGKPYYLAPAYPALFAGGAVLLEQCFQRYSRRWARPVLLVGLGTGGAFTSFFALPVLPLPLTDALLGRMLGAIVQPSDLTGEFHQQYGWEELVDQVAAVYHSLPAEEQQAGVLLTRNYSQAAALDFFGPSRSLPPTVSGHLSYYLWGPGQREGKVLIACGLARRHLEPFFGEITEVGRTFHSLALGHDNNLPIYLCRSPRQPVQEFFPALRNYDHTIYGATGEKP